MILIEWNGDQLLVDSVDGYPDAIIVAADVPAPTDDAADLVDGQWLVPIDLLKQRKRTEIDAHLENQFAAGFSPDAGPLVGHTLQVRDVVDRTNWLTSQATYQAAIAAGFSNVVDASFRTAANETVTITYQEGFDTLMAMAAWGRAIMGRSWILKDNLEAMTDPAAVEAFDVATEWAALP